MIFFRFSFSFTGDIIQTEKVIFRDIYVYPYMHVTAIIERRSHEFEKEQGGTYGRA